MDSGKKLLAIDIGSKKVCAIIAEVRDGKPRLIGAGVEKSSGLKKGSITNIEQASKSIKQAFEYAKRVAGISARDAVVSISGGAVIGIDSHAIFNIQSGEITIQDIEKVMKTSQYNLTIPPDYEVLHILPYNFKVDEQDYVEDPLGMNASRLEVFVHIITAPKSNVSNLKRAVELAGLEVSKVILDSYASYIATINSDERSLGCGVIDLGGDTSSFVIHAAGNAIRSTGFLGVGSDNVTNDLSMALHTPVHIAESVKITYGSLMFPYEDDLIEIPAIGDETSSHEVALNLVGKVVYARVQETLSILEEQIYNTGLRREIGAGFVLTGGLTKLEGVRELAGEIFKAPIRLAQPRDNIDGLFNDLRDPSFSTAIGLILHSTGEHTLYEFDSNWNMLYNNDSVDEQRGSSRVDLEDIGPGSYGVPKEQVIENPTPRKKQDFSKEARNTIPQGGRPSPRIPKTDLGGNQQVMRHPVENDLPGNYGDLSKINNMKTNTGSFGKPNTQNNQMSKIWQWINQIF
ncbi:Cell division protein FtsA [Thiovulum sp. ES]|nr:Cell division protein FtsA [Thiovulum sp. ES]